MNEDVLGPRQTVVGQHYENCERCGTPTVRAALEPTHLAGEGPGLGPVRPMEATRDAPPALLCAACVREVAAGEPLDLDDQGEADFPSERSQ